MNDVVSVPLWVVGVASVIVGASVAVLILTVKGWIERFKS